jgi:hypothetical protein
VAAIVRGYATLQPHCDLRKRPTQMPRNDCRCGYKGKANLKGWLPCQERAGNFHTVGMPVGEIEECMDICPASGISVAITTLQGTAGHQLPHGGPDDMDDTAERILKQAR